MISKQKLAIFMLIIISVLIINSAGAFASDGNWDLMGTDRIYEWWQYTNKEINYRADLVVKTSNVYIGEWIIRGDASQYTKEYFALIDFWTVVYNGFDDKGNIHLLVYQNEDCEKGRARLYEEYDQYFSNEAEQYNYYEVKEYIKKTDTDFGADDFSAIVNLFLHISGKYSEPSKITVNSSKIIYLINHKALPPFKIKTSRDSSLIDIIVRP